ncbi:MAG: sigma-70 family RNA polymerase sigma factor [Firmicutes bacterium]|nr:sigma-70 family RNA polymerase sigma factor [Bacillota bacterium]
MSDQERPPESDLIARSIEGDGDAFGLLVQPYLGLFSAGIQRILQDTLDTQDALQEALLTLFTQLHRFQGKSKFSTWAYRVCLNEALMARRSRIRRREDTLEDFLPHVTPEGHHQSREGLKDLQQEATALEHVEEAQVRQKVHEGLHRLSEEQRAVFVLRDLQGMDTEEVASALGISRGLVRQRLHRARLGLRSTLAPFLGHGKV